MPTLDRRSRKRLATRRAISDAATHLFEERGFDQVTIEEIAEAADVGRATVFNHFPRKEDMFFDLDEFGREDLRTALQQGDRSVAPIETLHQFIHRAVEEQKPYVRFMPESQKFIETMTASEPLKARARAIRDELTQMLTLAMSEAVGRDSTDPDARVAAGLLVAIWGIALAQAHEVFRKSKKSAEAQAMFLALVDKGIVGLNVILAGTPYV